MVFGLKKKETIITQTEEPKTEILKPVIKASKEPTVEELKEMSIEKLQQWKEDELKKKKKAEEPVKEEPKKQDKDILATLLIISETLENINRNIQDLRNIQVTNHSFLKVEEPK
jgi:hypothetical protein